MVCRHTNHHSGCYYLGRVMLALTEQRAPISAPETSVTPHQGMRRALEKLAGFALCLGPRVSRCR